MYIWDKMDANNLRTILDDLLLSEISQDKAWDSFFNIMKEMMDDENSQSYDCGYEDGYDVGRDEGYDEGHQDGLEEGFEEGAKTANG